MKECSIERCPKPAEKRGWCSMHYSRWKRHGSLSDDFARGNVTPTKRLAALRARMVEDELGCWIWTGNKLANGYGVMRIGQKRREYVHRVSYMLYKGAIKDGCEIDHLCRVRLCVNPEHLEAVPSRINWLRGASPAALGYRANRCRRGHELTPENSMVNAATGQRRCRKCNYEWQRRRRRSSPTPH